MKGHCIIGLICLLIGISANVEAFERTHQKDSTLTTTYESVKNSHTNSITPRKKLIITPDFVRESLLRKKALRL